VEILAARKVFLLVKLAQVHDFLALLQIILVPVVDLFDDFVVAPGTLLNLVQVVAVDFLLTLEFLCGGLRLDSLLLGEEVELLFLLLLCSFLRLDNGLIDVNDGLELLDDVRLVVISCLAHGPGLGLRISHKLTHFVHAMVDGVLAAHFGRVHFLLKLPQAQLDLLVLEFVLLLHLRLLLRQRLEHCEVRCEQFIHSGSLGHDFVFLPLFFLSLTFFNLLQQARRILFLLLFHLIQGLIRFRTDGLRLFRPVLNDLISHGSRGSFLLLMPNFQLLQCSRVRLFLLN
jgi:hypothetical protein